MKFLQRLLKFWLYLIIVICSIYFALNNQDYITVRITYGFALPPLPAYLVYVGIFFLGAMCASIFFTTHAASRSWHLRKVKRRLHELESTSSGTPDLTRIEEESRRSARDHLSY